MTVAGGRDKVARPLDTPIQNRDQLCEALARAAELEHLLVCQYLFAAYSLKTKADDPSLPPDDQELLRGWRADLSFIARQEMAHLGIVHNLAVAISSPLVSFARPSFPHLWRSGASETKLELLPFGEEALERFIRLERPFSEAIRDTNPTDAGSIYRPILLAFTDLSPAELFGAVAATANAVDDEELIPPRGGHGIYLPPVGSRWAAIAALLQIVEEGGGSELADSPRSHYVLLTEMFAQLRQRRIDRPGFEPAKRVAINPSLSGGKEGSQIGDPAAVLVAKAFDRAYLLTLIFLQRMWSSKRSARDLNRLSSFVFKPLMTMLVGPLGSCLMKLPLDAGSELKAGPPFELDADELKNAKFPGTVTALAEEIHELLKRARAACAIPELAVLENDSALFLRRWRRFKKLEPVVRTYRLMFRGYFQNRIGTDPDPPSDTRGSGGYTFAFGDEPDLNGELRLRDPQSPRTHVPNTVGVKVFSVENVSGENDKTAVGWLNEANIELGGPPSFVGRNGLIAAFPDEPIDPLEIIISGPDWKISRKDQLDPERKGTKLQDATTPQIRRRTGRLLDNYRHAEKEPEKYRTDRAANLNQQLAGATGDEKIILEGRIKELAKNHPEDRRVKMLTEGVEFNLTVNGEAEFQHDGTHADKQLDISAPWPLNFEMGAWDADALMGRIDGWVEISFLESAIKPKGE